MPWTPSDYPPDWRAVVVAVRARAGDRCEAVRPDGTRCNAARHAWVHRRRRQTEDWYLCASPDGWDCSGRDVDEVFPAAVRESPVRIVLTTAHTCTCVPKCGRLDHLLSLCQLHHLKLDAESHRRHAAATRAATRAAKQLAAGYVPLFDDPYADRKEG